VRAAGSLAVTTRRAQVVHEADLFEVGPRERDALEVDARLLRVSVGRSAIKGLPGFVGDVNHVPRRGK